MMSHIPETTATHKNLTQWYESVTLELGDVDETGIIQYLDYVCAHSSSEVDFRNRYYRGGGQLGAWQLFA